MLVKVSNEYAAPADLVWALVKQSATLRYVCRGLLGFSGTLPEEWEEGRSVSVRLFLFNFLPAWRHKITVEKIDDDLRKMQTKEGGGLIKHWSHQITVEPRSDCQCRYTDEIDIKAGLLTPLIWLYAQLLYRYRQRRWRKLLRSKSMGSE